MSRAWRDFLHGPRAWWVLASASALALGAGACLAAVGQDSAARTVWSAATIAALIPLVRWLNAAIGYRPLTRRY